MAYKCGDNTAARMGRLTINPFAHLDPIGSLMILFVGFGWAKPVPVDGRFLAKPRTDMMKIAAAGPVANLLLAMVSGFIFRFFNASGLLTEPMNRLGGNLTGIDASQKNINIAKKHSKNNN